VNNETQFVKEKGVRFDGTQGQMAQKQDSFCCQGQGTHFLHIEILHCSNSREKFSVDNSITVF
jgi:hypothetical protein